MATKGPGLPLQVWMARATSSLPVPVSPVTRTLASVGATGFVQGHLFGEDQWSPLLARRLCDQQLGDDFWAHAGRITLRQGHNRNVSQNVVLAS